MATLEFEDRLESVGIVVGVLLLLVGLGTLAGMPWQRNADVAAVVVELVGIAATFVVGAALIWIARSG